MSDQELDLEIPEDYKLFDPHQETYVHLTEAKALDLFRDFNDNEYDGITSDENLYQHYINDIFSYTRVISAMNSFESFIVELGYTPASHILQIVKAIINHSQVVVKAPRGHAKSKTLQLFSVWIMIFPQVIKWAWKKDPKVGLEILQISYSDDQAREWQGEFQKDLKRAIEIYNLPLHTVEKNKSGTVLNNNSEIISKGMTGALRGYHPHIILCDDLLTDRKYINDILLANIFYQTILGMALPKSKVAVVGTPLRYNDLLAELSELPYDRNEYEFTDEGYVISKREFVYLKFKARYADGKILWPEFRDKEYLDKKERTMGHVRFAREYLCEPMSEEGALFDADALDRCDRESYVFGQVGNGDLYVGCDLAISTSPNSSNTAFTLWEEIADDVLLLRDFWEIKVKENKPKVRKLYEWDVKYGPIKHIEIEKNQYQESMEELVEDNSWRKEIEQEFRAEGFIKRPLRKLPISLSATTWKKNEMIKPKGENISIRGIAMQFEAQNILFPTGNEESVNRTKEFKAELRTWILNPETGDPECLAQNDDKTMSMYVMWRGYKRKKSKGGGSFYFID